MAKFRSRLRKGPEAIQARLDSAGASTSFTPVHQFKLNEIKYLQFLEPIEDVPEVLMHQFITVGYRENGSEIYERFISRKDPNLDGPEGDDPLVDRFGLVPTSRCITLAVEMEPVYGDTTPGKRKVIEDWKVAQRQFENRDGETVTVPNVALVIESPFTLFGHLTTMADIGPIEDTIFGIKQTSTLKDFTVIQTNTDALDLSEELAEFFEEFDFDAWLEELADVDRMHALIDPLPDDFPVSKYGGKAKGKAKKTETSTRSRRAKEEEPDEEPEDEPQVRQRRFQDLKNQARSRASKV